MKPVNGEKTHPLTPTARAVLRSLVKAPMPRQEVNPGVRDRLARRGSGSCLAYQGCGLGGSEGFRCCGVTSSEGTIWMWSACWTNAKTSPRSWATSSALTDAADSHAGGARPEVNDRSTAACSPSRSAGTDPEVTSAVLISPPRSCRLDPHPAQQIDELPPGGDRAFRSRTWLSSRGRKSTPRWPASGSSSPQSRRTLSTSSKTGARSGRTFRRLVQTACIGCRPRIRRRSGSPISTGRARRTRRSRCPGADHLLLASCKNNDCADDNMALLRAGAQGRVHSKMDQCGKPTLIGAPATAVAAEPEQI